jgi:hypothetical protein
MVEAATGAKFDELRESHEGVVARSDLLLVSIGVPI